MSTNNKPIDLSIQSMQSTHCQNRVSNAISKIDGVEIKNIAPGKLSVLLSDEKLQENLISVIEKTGYSVSKDKNNERTSYSTGCCTH